MPEAPLADGDLHITELAPGFAVTKAYWSAGSSPAPVPGQTIYSRSEFKRLFSDEEFYAITQVVAKAIPLPVIPDMGLTEEQVWLKVWRVKDEFETLEYVDVADPLTAQGLQLLVAVGLLTTERMAQVLAGEVPG